MQYRPSGWDKEHPNPCVGCKDKAKPGLGDFTSAKYCLERCTKDDEYDSYEAGADAYEKGLCTDENIREKYAVPTALNPNGKRGWLVFIEKDTE